MKSVRRATSALLAAIAMFVSLFAFSTPAYASSDYDSLLQVAPTLTVYTNGSTKTTTQDISSTWWRDFKQSYALRVAQGIGWPTNFATKFEQYVSSGGSWGVFYYDTSYGTLITLLASDDPSATCSFTGPASTGSYDCVVHAGYGYVRENYFTHNSFGGNGCWGTYANRCSGNGMNMYDAPVVVAASGSSYTPITISNTDLPYAYFYIWNFNNVYPSGYAGEELPTTKHPTGAEYVAMGDSYSSGEGSPSFDSWTTQPDVNKCHRSASNAYPVMLAADEDLDLNLVNFVACSGATTDTLLNGGQWNEPAQINALSSSTDVITLTIGGNDVGFVDYAQDCEFNGWCEEGTDSYENIMDAIDGSLEGDLEITYSGILDQAENATLYVSGYPYLVDPLAGCVSFGWEDDLGVTDVISSLNDVIHDAVDEVVGWDPSYAGRIVYVEPNGSGSPFEDHYLCSTVPYFNPAIYSPDPSYSFHPNQYGQLAYKALLTDAMN